MKLRNKKTGEICELGHIRQAWREEKDGGMGYMLLKADDNNGIIYNSLAEMMEEWEDYIPKEPLIKNKEIREIVRAWADVNDAGKLKYNSDENSLNDIYRNTITFNRGLGLKDGHSYTIPELCGDEEE